MEPNSALASLTANYTDSEPEELTDDESSSNAVVITSTAPSASNSPSSRESQSQQLSREDASQVDVKIEKKPQRQKKSRLVSYQDDLIDDDVVDDYEASDGRDEQMDNSDDNSDQNESDIDEERENKMNLDEEVNSGDGGEDGDSSKKRIKLPPEPSGKCSVELQDKIKNLFERKHRSGFDMNEYIQRNKSFRNPSIYEKLIKYCDLDELGTNYPPDKYDPHEWKTSSFYDELAKTQKVEMEKREKERKDRTKVEFVSGTVRKPTSGTNNSTSTSQGEAEKRKSKWDQRGVMPPLLAVASVPVQQQGQIPPPTLLSATGTKSTVINAFGNPNPMHKKPKP